MVQKACTATCISAKNVFSFHCVCRVVCWFESCKLSGIAWRLNLNSRYVMHGSVSIWLAYYPLYLVGFCNKSSVNVCMWLYVERLGRLCELISYPKSLFSSNKIKNRNKQAITQLWAAVSALWAFLPSRLSSFYCILLFYMLLILSVSTNKIYKLTQALDCRRS